MALNSTRRAGPAVLSRDRQGVANMPLDGCSIGCFVGVDIELRFTAADCLNSCDGSGERGQTTELATGK